MGSRFLLFALISAAVFLPVSPFLAQFGLGVCPILNEKGFSFGCQLNFKFVLFLLGSTLSFASALQSSFVRKTIFKYYGAFSIPVSLILFQSASLLTLFYVKQKLFHVIGQETGMAFAVTKILTAIGIALTSFQTLLLETNLGAANRRDFKILEAPRLAHIVTEIYSLAQQIVVPLLVLSIYFELSLTLSDTQVDGWDSAADQTQKLEQASSLIFTWYILMNIVSLWNRWNLVQSLSEQAETLVQEEKTQTKTIETLGWLEPLGRALNKSAQILEQKRKLSQGFAKFVSHRMLEEILNKDQQNLFGQQVKCGIIMTDLRDFTNLSSHLTPKQVVRMLNLYFEDMIEVLSEHSIVVDKFIGDGLLAYIPCEGEWTPEKVATTLFDASRAMLTKLKSTNQKLIQENLPPLMLGIGLHVGDVVLGAMGSSQRMQYTIIGDAVNMVSRLESLCKELKSSCVASKDLYTLLPLPLGKTLQMRQGMSIKGIDHKVDVYYLENPVALKLVA